MVSCLFCRKKVWYRRGLSNPFSRNSEKTYVYECSNCKILLVVKNESDRKTRGTKRYWQDKTIVKGKVMKILIKNAK